MTFDYSKIKGDFSLLWTTFKNSLMEAIHETNFNEAWKTRSDRTRLYFKDLLPKVASKMNFDIAFEMKFRIDCTFYVKAGQGETKVPIVFIESENDAKSSDDEVYKLCLLNAPLKVLIICHDWNETTKKYLSEGYWNYIIENFAEESSLSGYFAIIIAEWDESLKFYTYVYDEKGNKINKEDGLLIEI